MQIGLGAALLLLALAGAAGAQVDYTPVVDVVRTDTPPLIDGRLDEPVWERAGLIPRLTTVHPVPDKMPLEGTEVRFLYDAHNLYVGVHCFEREPEKIIARLMERDANTVGEDAFGMVIDTFLDRRNAYNFQMNPNGLRADALVEDNVRYIVEWDGIWTGKTTIDAEGWHAEIAIPFKTLSFDPDSTVWGFNIARQSRHHNEESRWADTRQNFTVLNVSRAGLLRGLEGLEGGHGLDVKPFGAFTYAHDSLDDDDDRIGKAGGDVFYKLLPQLTGALTINSDFSEAPPDLRLINLTRFPSFFPETRDFFLQDAGIFEFAGLGKLVDRNGLPFDSRRIGLAADGEVVQLRGGAKTTGRIGRVGLGLLDVQMEPFDQVEAKNLFVGRTYVNVLEESSIGLIATNGDPLTNEDNHLVGADFRYRNYGLRRGQALTGDLWFQRSSTSEFLDPNGDPRESGSHAAAFGARLEYPNDRWNGELRFAELQEDFYPALGFVNRTGIRQYVGRARYRTRPQSEWLRTVDHQLEAMFVSDRQNVLETARVDVDFLDLKDAPEDRLRLRYTLEEELLRLAFPLPDPRVPEVTIPPGRYRFHTASVLLEASETRIVSGSLELRAGRFFDGRRVDAIGKVGFRPSPHFALVVELQQYGLRSELGNLTARLFRTRAVVNFTPDLQWVTTVQYENITKSVGLHSRIRWEVQPGNELFLVFRREDPRSDERRAALALFDATASTLKLVYTLRF